MWALRILNGPQAGELYTLKQGKNRLGRSPQCDFSLQVPGISKEHFEIMLFGEKMVLTDLQSSNGTLVNGVRVQNAILHNGDKIMIDKILFDVVMAPRSHTSAGISVMQSQPLSPFPSAFPPANPSIHAGVDFSMPSAIPSSESSSSVVAKSFQEKVEDYIQRAVMPGFQKLMEVFEFKIIIFSFAAVFILMVTVLSLFPMNQITSESIKNESRRRAQTVARALANSNEKAIRSGDLTSYSSDLVLKDDGISDVMILSKDGSIMAPPEMLGMSPHGDLVAFATQIKGQLREVSAEIGNGRIAASCPILVYDSDIQQNVAKAYAIVVYDTGTMKYDDGRALSLFIQMLCISLALGIFIFYLMYKMIELPFIKVSQELDLALREGRDQIQIPFQFPILQNVLVGLNSLLARVQNSGSGSMNSSTGSRLRDSDWVNLVHLMGYPTLLVSKDQIIVAANHAFESLSGYSSSQLLGQAIQVIGDQAMQKNIGELITLAQSNTLSMHSDKLEISGHMFLLQCQAMTADSEAHYFMVTVSPYEAEAGGAA